jgi:hypothetical protein
LACFACVAALALFCACGRAVKTGEWDDGNGTKITWSPARPEMGDLVSLTLETGPQAKAAADSRVNIQAPDGRALEPLSRRYLLRNVLALWSFRIEAPGEYRWKGRALWSTESAAGKETELKTFEPQALWAGKAKSAASAASVASPEPATAPQSAPAQALPAKPVPAQPAPIQPVPSQPPALPQTAQKGSI